MMYCSSARAQVPLWVRDDPRNEVMFSVECASHRCARAVRHGAASTPEYDGVEVVETLRVLECAAAALGGSMMGEDDVIAARRVNDLLGQTQQWDLGMASTLARQFHQMLLVACPNEYMLALLERERRRYRSSLGATSLGAPDPLETARQHGAILELIEADAGVAAIESTLIQDVAGNGLCCAIGVR
jgi:DNA-binding FadR family transcriptional regulator